MPLLTNCLTVDTVEYGKLLLLADTHVGYEFELIIRGIRVPRQTQKMAEHYIALAQREKASGIVIVGDIKHEIPVAIETAREVETFLSMLSEHLEHVILTPGNHDGGIDKIVQRLGKQNIKLTDSRGLMLTLSGSEDKILFLHGNAKPKVQDFLECSFLVIGHTHPAVSLRDPIGYVVREPVIVKAQLTKRDVFYNMYRKDELKNMQVPEEKLQEEFTLVILPCANPFVTGTDITRTLLQKSPISKTILSYFQLWNHPDKIEVYLQDLTYLGTLDFLLSIERVVETRESVNWDFL